MSVTSSEDETQNKATHKRKSAKKNHEKKRSTKLCKRERSRSFSSNSETSSDSQSESDNKHKLKSNKRKHNHSKKFKRSSSTREKSPTLSTSRLIQPKKEYQGISDNPDSEAPQGYSATKKPVDPKENDAEISQDLVANMYNRQFASTSGKSDQKDKLKDISLKLDFAKNKLTYVCKTLMVCDTKGCQFNIMHDCLRFYNDLVKPQDSTIKFTDILEKGKVKNCEWCGFIVTHKKCFRKPKMLRFGLTTVIGSYTRGCTNCNWQATYSINTEISRICQWDDDNSSSTGPNTCCCGCIEIYHKCTPESRKINQNNVTGKY